MQWSQLRVENIYTFCHKKYMHPEEIKPQSQCSVLVQYDNRYINDKNFDANETRLKALSAKEMNSWENLKA